MSTKTEPAVLLLSAAVVVAVPCHVSRRIESASQNFGCGCELHRGPRGGEHEKPINQPCIPF